MADRPDPISFLSALKGMGIERYFYEREDGASLPDLRRGLLSCRTCKLHETRRTVVFGEGDPDARLMFIGEAPGEEEDRQGRPFVGRAGKFLDRMIEKVGLERSNVFICNVLKCRPPGNRDPEPEEVEACSPYLFTQIDLVAPRLICTLGRHAYNTLMATSESIMKVRGVWARYRGIPLLPTYHPSFLLRNEARVKEAFGDMEKLRQALRGN